MVPENLFDIKVAQRIISDLYQKHLRFSPAFYSWCLRVLCRIVSWYNVAIALN